MRGYSYALEDEKLLAYMKLSDEDKLNWLEEINAFNDIALTEKQKGIRENLRNGEI